MISRIFSILTVLLIISCTFKHPNKSNNIEGHLPDSLTGLISQEEYSNGWRSLFNGINLDGWKGYLKHGPVPGWFVTDSMLITKGDSLIYPGDLITIEQYEDFILYLEWAICWQGNSGIFFHSLENSWAAWAMGPEYAIVDQSNLGPMESIYRTGANYGMHPPDEDIVNPQGAFNTSMIKVQDAKVEHWLNGQKVVEYELWTDDWYEAVAHSKWKDYPQYGRPIKGSIGLQGHGFETKFRNIKIKDITDVGKPLKSFFVGNEWQPIGNSLCEFDNEEIKLKGQGSGIQGTFSNNDLAKNFIVRFQFKSNNPEPILIYFSSNGELESKQDNIKTKDSKLIVNEDEVCLLLTSTDVDRIHAGQWNELIIRNKGDQILIWLNNNMIIEENGSIFPTNLKYIDIKIPDSLDNELSLRNMFFRKLN